MKVILQQEVKKLGRKGDIIEVSEGYARNYLFPRGLAVEATAGNLKSLQQQKDADAKKQQKLVEQARQLADTLNRMAVTVRVKTGEAGRLFGSVTSKDIADALARQHRIDLDRRKIELKEGIKSLGTYTVPVKLHADISAALTVAVVADEKGENHERLS